MQQDHLLLLCGGGNDVCAFFQSAGDFAGLAELPTASNPEELWQCRRHRTPGGFNVVHDADG
jgi:hypothetical protein